MTPAHLAIGADDQCGELVPVVAPPVVDVVLPVGGVVPMVEPPIVPVVPVVPVVPIVLESVVPPVVPIVLSVPIVGSVVVVLGEPDMVPDVVDEPVVDEPERRPRRDERVERVVPVVELGLMVDEPVVCPLIPSVPIVWPEVVEPIVPDPVVLPVPVCA